MEPTVEDYPDFTDREFLSLHVRHLYGNLCSFRSHSKLVQLECKYSHAKNWAKKFFFVLGRGCGFSADEASY